jgi:hypothetical protein
VLYVYSDPKTHLGAFFGNAIADWTGVVVTITRRSRWRTVAVAVFIGDSRASSRDNAALMAKIAAAAAIACYR